MGECKGLFGFYKPIPAPSGVFEIDVVPHRSASPLSKLFVQYITPIRVSTLLFQGPRPANLDDWGDVLNKEFG
jgi:hypothetical protein